MAEILLLHPTYRGRKPNYIPSGLLCVAAILKAKGHRIQIVDSQVHKYRPREALQAIAKIDFSLLGIGGISTSYYFWKEFVPLFRQKYGDRIPIMAGGSVASTMPEPFLKFIEVDAICTGDAEPVVAELTEHLLHHRSLDNLDGIGYRKSKDFVIKPGLRVKDMDSDVPIPPYDLIDIDDYRISFPPHSAHWYYIKQNNKRKKALEFMLFSSRGCPYNCFFCSRNFGRQFVQHSVDKFIEHMIFIAKNYSPDFFCIEDELMTMRHDWVVEFCAKYKASGMDVPYRMNARVDTIDKELLMLLKNSHCFEVDLGIESGSPIILKEMNKRVTVEQNKNAIRWCKEVGLYPSPTMVFGMPSETMETIEETKKFLIEEDVRTFGSFYATAYPASLLFQYAISKGMIQNIDEYMLKVDNASRLMINYTVLSDQSLQKKVAEVGRNVLYTWYKRRRMWWKILKLKLGLGLDYIKKGINTLLKEGPISLIGKVIEKTKSYKT